MRLATPLASLFLALALLPAVVGATAFHGRFGPAPETVAAPSQTQHLTVRVADAGRFNWLPGFYPGTPAISTPALAFGSFVTPTFQDPTPTLSLYPNPARGLVSVQLTAQHGPEYKLRLSNVLGREVRLMPLPLATASTGLPLDVSGLPAGLYFCSLLVNDKAVSTNRLTLL